MMADKLQLLSIWLMLLVIVWLLFKALKILCKVWEVRITDNELINELETKLKQHKELILMNDSKIKYLLCMIEPEENDTEETEGESGDAPVVPDNPGEPGGS